MTRDASEADPAGKSINFHSESVGGLSFGALKEQEFTFCSKLNLDAHGPKDSSLHRARSNSLPLVPSCSRPSVVREQRKDNFKLQTGNPCQSVNIGQIPPVPPNSSLPAVPPLKHRPAPPIPKRVKPRRASVAASSISEPSVVVQDSTVHNPAAIYNNLPRQSGGQYYRFSAGVQLTTINEECEGSRNAAMGHSNAFGRGRVDRNRFERLPVQQSRTANFISGDPHSDRLSLFVSKMVYIIFWHGSDSFNCHGLTTEGSSDMLLTECAIHQYANEYKPPLEFTRYTKYLLETMQISCSTALLSLFYLHRLRPRVKHLFAPGTFNDCNALPGTQQKHQYRRDPKLEYRLFTISIVLANKYLDDNSYSNKAWSDVTGLELRKVNIMELEFMKYIDYCLLVREKEYVSWVKWLENHIRSVMIEPAPVFDQKLEIQRHHHHRHSTLPHNQHQFPPTPSSAKKAFVPASARHSSMESPIHNISNI